MIEMMDDNPIAADLQTEVEKYKWGGRQEHRRRIMPPVHKPVIQEGHVRSKGDRHR